MRFAPILLLLTAASFCSAQTVVVSDNNECAAARIVTPPGAFAMPVAKTPEMPIKGNVISTKPPCAQSKPKELIARQIQISVSPTAKPRHFELAPNPFTPPAK